MLCRIVGRGVASLGLISAVALLTVSGCTGSPNPGGDPSPLDPVTNGLIVNGYVNVTTDPNEPNQPAAYSTQQYEFNADPISGSRPLTVTCAVSTITGDPLASGTYAWKFDGVEESGPMAEYAQRSHVFQTGGAHTIALAVSLLGVSAPISCTSKQTRTTQCVVVVAPRISGHVLDASGQGISGVVVAGNAGAGTAVSATDGAYEIEVPYNWSGQIGPQNSTLIFQQSTRSYSNAKQDLTGQDFSVAAAAKVKIAGSIHDSSGNPLAGVALAADNSGGSATTGADGSYQFELTGGWSGKITPTLKDFAFTPSDRSYSNLTADAQSQDFAGNSTVPATVKIAGCVKDPNGAGISGVPVVASNGGPSGTTDANGRYELTVAYHWNGTITPSNESYTFVPSSRPYADATANLSSEDFAATPVLLVFPKVSGYVKDAENRPVQGVTLTATSSEARATTDANGFYEMTMTINWSGKITPALGEYGFEPAFIEYTSLSTNLTQQNYKAMAPAPVGSRTISGVCKDALGTGLVGIVLTASTGETAASGPGGAYALSLSEGWSGTITPGNGDPNCTFVPAKRDFTPLSGDQTDQDFVIQRTKLIDPKTSTTTWQYFALPAAQSGTFTFEFDSIPNQANMDGVTGLSGVAAPSKYSDFAVLVRFNTTGTIDVRNGSAYTASASVAYVAGAIYHFKVVVNVTNHTYDVTVTPEGGSPVVLAQSFAFRTEQAAVTSLTTWGLIGAVLDGGARIVTHQVGNCNVAGAVPTNQAPVVNAGTDRLVNLSTGGITVTLDATVTDDGLPNPPGKVTTTWSKVSGAGTVAFGDASAVDTTATFTVAGSYELRLTGNDGQSTASDSAMIHILPVMSVQAATTGGQAPLTVEFTAKESSGSLDPNHLPAGCSLKWNFGDGGTNAVVTGPASQKAKVSYTFVQAGTFTVVLSVAVGSLETSCCLLQITVQAAPGDRAMTPVIEPNQATYDATAGAYMKSVRITITGDPNSTIRYTTDGLEPTAESTHYTDPNGFVLDGTTTVKAKAFKSGLADSDTASKSLTVKSNVLSQYGITWNLDANYVVGHFVTGDWWVVGPVTVTAISPAPGSGRNGSMINPAPGTDQAYDDRLYDYKATLLKNPPFTLSTGQSLVSSISVTTSPYTDLMGVASSAIILKGASILTSLATTPPSDAFRPPYMGTAKQIYLKSGIQWQLLPKLPTPASAPSLSTYERYFQRPWLDHKAGWAGRSLHPGDNMPGYGRELVTVVGDAALLLCLNYSNAKKESLLIGMTQVGIDNYHTALLHKGMWATDGGHMMGRKFPIQFAGIMLGQSGMLTLNDYDNQEDLSTYYGDTTRVLWTGWQNSGHAYAKDVQYLPAKGVDSRGLPYNFENYHPSKWGGYPFDGVAQAYAYDKQEPYRRLVAQAYPGEAIAARILGLRVHWNHDAFFDYVDRWMYEDDTNNFATIQQYWPSFVNWNPRGQTCTSQFAKDMYLTYRPSY